MRDPLAVLMDAQRGGPALRIAVYMHDLAGGGSERANLSLILAWRAAGHAVTLLLHRKTGELADFLPPDLPVVDFATSRAVADVPPLARYLRSARPDILLTSLDHNNIVGLMAKVLAGSRVPVIICQHNPFTNDPSRMQAWTYHVLPVFYRLLTPLAAGVVAVSEGVAADFSRATGAARHRISTIYNPVIGLTFEARAAEPVSHPWFDQPGPPVYVTASRLVAQKGHDHLLRGFARHCQGGTSARLMILGDGPMRADLEALAVELGIAHCTEFAGFVANPLPYVKRSAAFVLTSRYEGFGNVLVEAFGVGTPVISVDCDYGPSEILDGGRYGVLVPPGDVDALAAAFSPDLRERWPAAVLRARASHFTSAASAESYLELIWRKVHEARGHVAAPGAAPGASPGAPTSGVAA